MCLNRTNVGIGTVTPSYKLDDSGTLRVTSSCTADSFPAKSDIKLKENIVALDDPLEKVLRLQGAEFNWKNDETKKKTVGFIAQEVEEIIPEVVNVGNDEIRSLNYNGIVPYLVESIKIQQQ